MAGPWSKKSTRIKVGAFPYAVLQLLAVSPRLPIPPDGALVVVMFPTSGVSIPKASSVSRKWFMKAIRPELVAAEVSPLTAVGRSGRQLKFDKLVTSKGFSQIKVNSSMRYGATVLLEGSREATKVMSRVLFEISSWRVGQLEGGVVAEGGV